MSIRITGGDLRGRMVPSPAGSGTRPTGALARQALFNILNSVEGARVLDLYCGSGIMGLEALSRGAALLHAVEISKPQARQVQKVYQDLGVASRAHLHTADVLELLRRPLPDAGTFDLIYADPPFTREYPDLRPFREWLAAEGVAVFEAPSRSLPVWASEASDLRRYGESTLLFFHRTY